MLNRKQEKRTPKFMDCIGEIEKCGHTLLQALLARNADAIWKAIALQEESLNHLRLWRARAAAETDGAQPGNPATTGFDPLSREIMKRTSSVLRTNRALARAFLDIIDKTLASIASGKAGGPTVYNQAGKVDPFSIPLFVQQRG